MARKRRHIQVGFCYHIMLRGNEGQDIFKDNADFVRFCLLLQYASEMHQIHIHGFCLMSNHVHLVIQPQSLDLAAGMHAVAFRYAQYFNKKYERVGYLYQGRYKAVLVQSGTYLRRLIRYVHLNPVRAKMMQTPEKYFWSSYRLYVGNEDCTWLTRTLVLDAFGGQFNDSVERLSRYTQMNDDEARDEAIEIRKSFHMGVYGDQAFFEKWRPVLSKDKVQADFCRDDATKVSLENIVEAVCDRLNTPIEDIRSDKRSKELIFARTLMACLTQKLNAGSKAALGSYILRDPTSLAKLVRKSNEDRQVQIFTEELLAKLLPANIRVDDNVVA